MPEPSIAPPAPMRLDGVQILRAAAALMVLAHHTLQESEGAIAILSPSWFTTAGAAGVDLFFVLSGFVMAWIAFRKPGQTPAIGRFVADRITRILPLYWLCCLAMLSLAAIGFLRSMELSAASILQSFLLIPHEGRLLGVAWTLEYEIFFYGLFALWLPLRDLSRTLAGTALTIAAIVLLSPLLPDGTARAFLSNPVMLEFIGGMGIAWLFLRRPGWLRVPLALSLFAWAVLILTPVWVAHETTNGIYGWARPIFWGTPAVIIVAHAVKAQPRNNAPNAGLIRLGDASYALYLTHAFLMLSYAAILKRTSLGHLGQAPFILLVIAVAIAVALATHVLVEQPVIERIRHQFRRKAAAAPNPLVASEARS